MKKLFVCMLVLTLLVGCGKNNQQQDDIEYKSNIHLHYEGVDITPGQKFQADDIKKEVKVYERQSCAFTGMDKIYSYGNLEITTNVRDGYDLIYAVSIIGDDVENDEGIKMKIDKSEVEKAYKDKDEYSYEDDEGYYTIADQDVTLTIIETDGKVSTIDYSLNLEENEE